MNKFYIFLIIGLSQFTIACGQLKTQSALQNVNNGFIAKTERPACEVKSAEYALETKVIALEVVSSTNISMGFDILNKFLSLFKMSFKTKTGRLAMAMSLYDPIKPQYELMNVLGETKMKENEFKFDLGLSQIGIGFEHYYKTPMSLLFERGLKATMTNMDTAIVGLEDDWTTTVVNIPSGDEVIIPVGSFSGVNIGDMFYIYNIEHVWEGEPCTSEHLIARKTTARPVAVGIVSQREASAAVLKIQVPDASASARPTDLLDVGAQVEIAKLTGDPKRKLARSLEILPIKAEMEYEENNSVDISRFVNEQVNAVVHSSGYSVYRKNLAP